MKKIKNITASIRQRLRNIADLEKKAFQYIALLYAQERFLYRLSISPYSEQLLLKGGLLFFGLYSFKGRSTKDIDFSGNKISNDLDKIKNVIKEIGDINCNDGIIYDTKNIRIDKIKEGFKYEGVRVRVDSFLDKAKNTIQLDIGFGDTVIPKPSWINYPVLLDSLHFKIKAYSKESVIAEKFEAMISFSDFNSRMKDFYDINFLLIHENFKGDLLKKAIAETFKRRNTVLNENPVIFSDDFFNSGDRQKLWKGFIKRIGESDFNFTEVMNNIRSFLFPVYQSIMSDKNYNKIWNNKKLLWK